MLPEEEALAAVKENRAEKAAREAQAAQEDAPAPEEAAQEAAPSEADGPAREAAE